VAGAGLAMELSDQVCSSHKRMREIKFRAWHKHFKQMSNTIMTLGDAYFGFPNRTELRYWLHATDMEVMQFTGLKDKNGKEIWEGDVIHFNGWDFLIKFGLDESIATTGFFYIRKAKDVETTAECKGGIDFLAGGEVIGNIYENPELLNVKNVEQFRNAVGKESARKPSEQQRQKIIRAIQSAKSQSAK
jgi:uncharacterized phage protein (TIGR01671 family)